VSFLFGGGEKYFDLRHPHARTAAGEGQRLRRRLPAATAIVVAWTRGEAGLL
jgi:hypothetical protein